MTHTPATGTISLVPIAGIISCKSVMDLISRSTHTRSFLRRVSLSLHAIDCTQTDTRTRELNKIQKYEETNNNAGSTYSTSTLEPKPKSKSVNK